ncbi:hypothetical protein GIB67_037507 [Kingdonia uniflora]|uniref:Membrane-associated kinase regulator 4 n=1 Tax=Kingdonia uniflora TaxID=39325 RepID=A0A7J7NBF2_9MAGN|nr:hypothetical protein GIB67_037507 [Kingdonia uniflora]
MAINMSSSCDNVDEEYIDMEVSFSYTTTTPSPPHQTTREFEFQMSSNSLERETTASPADELFYRGKLLPLHLPPRLQMVQKLLQNSKPSPFENNYATTPTTTTYSTPLESCNVSPSDSRRVSQELNPNEYFYECATEEKGFIDEQEKKTWSKKLKLIRNSSLGLKLKASKAYLKSLFTKSGCSDESSTEATKNETPERNVSKAKECLNKYIKVPRKNPFGQIQRERYVSQFQLPGSDKEKMIDDSGSHRKSFSGAIKRHSATKSSSSSTSNSSGSSFSSSNSNGYYELHLLKRSSSANNSDIECSIQGAIAHCKQSQKFYQSKKTTISDCLLSTSEDQERPGISRG